MCSMHTKHFCWDGIAVIVIGSYSLFATGVPILPWMGPHVSFNSTWQLSSSPRLQWQHVIIGQRTLAWWYMDVCIVPLHSGRRCPARPDGDIRPEAILSTSFGSLRTAIHRQVTCTCQIWIPGWILPHFDVRTISVASKLKKLQIFLYYWQKIFDGTKLDSDGERSSGCECYSWRLIIPAHTLQHCTVGKYFD